MKEYTVLNWCEIFGIELLDNDGFRRDELTICTVTLERFVAGFLVCTIRIVDDKKYSVLEKLFS
jgi:hypothetical protein